MSQPSKEFNLAADKVVAFKELRQKRTALYRANLSTTERIYLNAVDKPFSAVIGLGIAIKRAVKGEKTEGSYIEPGTFNMYVSGAFMNATMKDAKPFLSSTAFQTKINDLFTQAFEQCEDVSKTPKMQALKPV
jgi:hypothetical protein